MHSVFAVLSLLSILMGISVLAFAKSAIHEIEAFVLFLISAVLISASAIIRGLKRLEHALISTRSNHEEAFEPLGMDKYRLASGITDRDMFIIGGIILVIVGLLIVTDSFSSLKVLLSRPADK